MVNCKICNEPLGLYKTNNQVYCSHACYTVSKVISDRLTKQRIKFKTMLKGKTCKRCGKHVCEPSMRKYCNECKEILNKPSKEKKMKICETVGCETSIPNQKKYCTSCARVRKLKRCRLYEAGKRAERGQEARVVKGVKPINPMFLVRGTISGGNRSYMMDAV